MQASQMETLPAEIVSEEAFPASNQGEMKIIDVRTPMEWMRTGLAQGAVPLSTQNPDFMIELEKITANDMNTPLGIICATGNRSAMVQQYLKQFGYTNVTNIRDGMMGNFSAPGWIRNNLPVEPYNS